MAMQDYTQSTAAGGRISGDGEDPIQTPTDAVHDASARFAELKSFIGYYLSAKTDGVKVSIRNAGLYAAVGIFGLIAGATFVVMACALLCLGIAHGFAALFGRGWVGDLVAGVILLALIGVGVFMGLRSVTSSSRKRTVEKYEQWQQQQRSEFGTDVREQAADAGK